jgi:hypothetical protein
MTATAAQELRASFADHYRRLAGASLPERRRVLQEVRAGVDGGQVQVAALVPLLLAESDAGTVRELTACWLANAAQELGREAAIERALDWLARNLASAPLPLAGVLLEDADEALGERIVALLPAEAAPEIFSGRRSLPTRPNPRPAGSGPARRAGPAACDPAAARRTRPSARTRAARSCASR